VKEIKHYILDTQKATGQTDKDFSIDSIVPGFSSHIPNWGGFFTYKYKKITVVNTCTIDNYLFSFWVLNQIIPNFIAKFPKLEQTNKIGEIITNIANNEWNRARQNWYSKIMKEDLSKVSEVDFYGEIEEYFFKYINIFQTHNLIQKCTENCVYNKNMILSDNSSIVEFGRLKDGRIALLTSEYANCSNCNARVTCDIKFKYDNLFIFMEPRSHFKINQLQDVFVIDNKNFKLLCSVLHLWRKKHFVTVYYFKGYKVLVDDLNPSQLTLLDDTNKNHEKYFKINVSSTLYYLVE
jgi:hypothetical protein